MSDDWSQFPTAPPAEHDWSAFPIGTQTLASEFGYVDNPARGGSGDPGTSGNWYTGAWGDDISNQRDLGVSLPRSILRQHFGDENLAHNAPVAVTNQQTGKTAVGYIRDKGPGESQRAGLDLMYAMAREIEAGHGLTPVSYRILAQGNQQAQDWSAFPTASPQTPQSQQTDRNLANDGTETGRNALAVAATAGPQQDWSAFPTAPPAPQEIASGEQRYRGVLSREEQKGVLPEQAGRAMQPVQQSSGAQSRVLPPVQSAVHEAMAQDASTQPGAAQTDELPVIRKSVPSTGQTDSAAMSGVRSDSANAPRGLQQTSRSSVALQGTSPGASQDWSAFPTTPPQSRVTPKPTPEATQWEPETQTPQESPFDTVHKTVQNYWENAKQSAAQLNLAAQQGSAYSPTLPTDPIEQEIKRTQESTLLTDDQKAQTIAALRKGQTTVQANRMGAIVTEKANIAQAEAAKPDKAFQESFLGRASGMAGQATPYLASGAAGPMAPILAATQMAAGAYGSAIDRSVQDAKRLHPDWSDAQLLVAANAAANESAKNAGAAGLALSLIPIPAAGPLIARMVEKWGLSAATMVLAQQYARVQENAALKKNINPSQDLLEGLRENLGQDITQGLAFGLPHALGEIGRGGQRQPPAAEIPRPEEQAPAPPEPVRGAERVGAAPQPQTQGQAASIGEPEIHELHPSGEEVNQPTPAPEIEQPPPMSSVRGAQARSQYAEQPQGQPVGGFKQEPFDWSKESPEAIQRHEQWVKNNPWDNAQEDERWVSAIANRFTEERSATGEIGEIAPGVGYSRTDLREIGLKMKPEQIAQHVSDLMHDTGDPKLQAAAITAEEARLSQRSSQLSRIAEDQPNPQTKLAAENAFQDLTDFHNGPVAQLKNNWHAQGMTLQGEIPVDLSTFNGLREAWLRDVGKPTTPDVEATMRRTAKNVRDAVSAENAALDQLAQKVESLKRAKIPSADDVRNNIMERMKNVPCIN